VQINKMKDELSTTGRNEISGNFGAAAQCSNYFAATGYGFN